MEESKCNSIDYISRTEEGTEFCEECGRPLNFRGLVICEDCEEAYLEEMNQYFLNGEIENE